MGGPARPPEPCEAKVGRRHPPAASENNVRKLIIDETPINPKYYEKMSQLLDALIEKRKQDALDYQDYLAQIVELTKKAKNGPGAGPYPVAGQLGAA